MKLKEAQMLGILALLAVGTVLLCMWGGDDVPDEGGLAQADEQLLGPADLQPSVRELIEELMAGEEPPMPAPEPQLPPASVVIGGATAPTPPTEEWAIRTVIEQTAPVEIPLMPRRPEPGATAPAPPARPAQAAPLKPVFHVVQKGDTLSEISQQYYGTCRHWRAIQKANAALVPDSALLRLGMRLRIPVLDDDVRNVAAAAAPTPVLSASSAQRTYTVVKGDNLWRIAEKCYQDGTRYKDIQAANRDRVTDPASVRPGLVLVIP